jgi:hypothetical protein
MSCSIATSPVECFAKGCADNQVADSPPSCRQSSDAPLEVLRLPVRQKTLRQQIENNRPNRFQAQRAMPLIPHRSAQWYTSGAQKGLFQAHGPEPNRERCARSSHHHHPTQLPARSCRRPWQAVSVRQPATASIQSSIPPGVRFWLHH